MKIVLILLMLISPLQATITGTWNLAGFLVTATPDAVTSPLSFVTGTAQVTSSSLSVTAGTCSFVDTETFLMSGDTYGYRMQDGSGNRSVTIRKIDDDTLLLSVMETDYTGDTPRHVDEFCGLTAVLTKDPYVVPTSFAWTARYSAKGVLKNEYFNSGVNSELLSSKMFIRDLTPRLRVVQPGVDQGLELNLNGNTASRAEIDTERELLWENSSYRHYNLEEREIIKVLHLGGGRVLLAQCDLRRAEGIGIPDPEDPSNRPPDYRFLLDMELRSHLLESDAIGRVEELQGKSRVKRGGKSLRLRLGMPIYEGDRIFMLGDSNAKVVLKDNTVFELEEFGRLEFTRYSYNSPGIPDALRVFFRKGRAKVTTGNMDKRGFFIRTRTAAFGVRGTTFTLEYDEDAGMGTSMVEVNDGIVDMTNLQTSAETELNVGDSDSVTGPVPNKTLTLNSPFPWGGSYQVNGQMVTSFPYVVTLPQGSEVSLLAVRDAGFRFGGWTGDLVSPDNSYVFPLEEDMTISGQFVGFPEIGDNYADLWNGTGYSIEAQLPGSDANGDGIPNAVAYSLGIPPAARITPEERLRLPRTVLSPTAGKSATLMKIPNDVPNDVTYRVEVSQTLESGETSWVEIASKQGNDDWEGTEALRIQSTDTFDGFVDTVFEYPLSYNGFTNGFMRVAVEAE